jgi:CBS-domain-containing membrane protein
MAEQQVRRLPVMNRQKRLVGVVSLSDVAESKYQSAEKVLRGISRDRGHHSQLAAE